MTFWTESTLSPTRQFRFMISDGSGDWWWVKSVSKPSYEISTEEYKLINHKYKYPGVLTWNDVTLTMVDTGSKTLEFYNKLYFGGYSPQHSFLDLTPDGISKKLSSSELNFGDFEIKQLDDEGTAVETWTLINSFIKSTNFGDLDYSSDELVTLELVISYDYATLT